MAGHTTVARPTSQILYVYRIDCAAVSGMQLAVDPDGPGGTGLPVSFLLLLHWVWLTPLMADSATHSTLIRYGGEKKKRQMIAIGTALKLQQSGLPCCPGLDNDGEGSAITASGPLPGLPACRAVSATIWPVVYVEVL